MGEPDYSKYSLTELHQALESIDKEAYPERLNAIQHRIDKLESQHGTIDAEKTTQSTEKKPLGPVGLAFVFAMTALFVWLSVNALLTGEISGKRGHVYTWEASPNMFLFMLGVNLFVVGVLINVIVKTRRLTQKAKQAEHGS